MKESNRRADVRLRLAYPIRLDTGLAAEGLALGRTVTRNLSARGAYFATSDAAAYSVGTAVGVSITVPHRLPGAGHDVMLDLRGQARVVRMDAPDRLRTFTEDGIQLTGIALRFDEPLQFTFAWA